MAKKKDGGAGASKKTEQKKKKQVIEDKTFGLKNKNKSKKVQQFVEQVEKNVFSSGDPKQRRLEEQRKKAKEEAKARKKALKEEQDALFGEALLAVQKKPKHADQKEGKMEAKGRDADDEDKKKGQSRAMKMMYQMDAKEMDERLREDPNYIPTLEDEIELQRQQKVEELKQAGNGTPVTEATFKAWQERKRKARAEEAKKLVEKEMKKKKGGKGLAVLSGRALYEYKASLFDVGNDEQDVDMTGPEGPEANGNNKDENGDVDKVAEKVKSDLFLEGDDDDLDDIVDD